ncbi:MAG TPA: DUF885 family protein, partial [Acidobacteriota bacterium]|nr:DUF885 family protein [Acidobacteriota bacterium]
MKPRSLLAGCALSLASVLSISAAVTPDQVAATADARVAAESAKANAFFERVFDEAVDRSPLLQTRLGVKKDYDKWDDLSEQRALEDFVLGVQQLADLKRTVNFEALDDQTKVSYRLFVRQAEEAIEGWKWRYHSYPLNQMSGLHSEAPAFLINFHRVDNVADARAYIARLRGMAPMFDQLIENVKVRAAKGILPPKFVFGLVIESCREVVTGEPFDQSGKPSALWEDAQAKIGALKDADAATQKQLL